MFDKERCLDWIQNEFPDVLRNHFNYNLMENLIEWAIKNKNYSKGQMIAFLVSIVPEITEEEWKQFYVEV